jgi:hypothetical protein
MPGGLDWDPIIDASQRALGAPRTDRALRALGSVATL